MPDGATGPLHARCWYYCYAAELNLCNNYSLLLWYHMNVLGLVAGDVIFLSLSPASNKPNDSLLIKEEHLHRPEPKLNVN